MESKWAYNSQGKVVKADTSNYGEGPFFCSCPHQHEVHLSKPSGKPEKRPFTPYFAHNSDKDRKSICYIKGKGESDDHLLAKALLKENVGNYMFALSQCSDCHENIQVIQTRVDDRIELEVIENHSDRKWRYDCCLYRNDSPPVCLEVCNTSKCQIKKVIDCQHRSVLLVEFDVQDVIKNAHNPNALLENKLIKYECCHTCLETRQEKLRKEQELARLELEKQKRQQEQELARIRQQNQKRQQELARSQLENRKRQREQELTRIQQQNQKRQEELARIQLENRKRQRQEELARIRLQHEQRQREEELARIELEKKEIINPYIQCFDLGSKIKLIDHFNENQKQIIYEYLIKEYWRTLDPETRMILRRIKRN
jgi:hypothetical protein